MSTAAQPEPGVEIDYPDNDGQPMSDNTRHFKWITTIKGGLDALFRDNPDVFVAGDLLWYPVDGNNTRRAAPDAMVVFNRPKGYRGSYQQWNEGGIAPSVVFEVLSPSDRHKELIRKFRFYEAHGVSEYYIYDPEIRYLEGWLRAGESLQEIPEMADWISPRLGIRFDLSGGDLRILRPDGQPFLTYVELARRQELDHRNAERLADQLRALGVEPDLS